MAASPPGFVRAALVPELLVSDLPASLHFWCGLCGFTVVYDRPEEGFAFLDRSGCQVMLEDVSAPGRKWVTGPLERPFGRGLNLELAVDATAPLLAAFRAVGWSLFLPPEERWYRTGDGEAGVRQFAVQDPDGYLVRFSEAIGCRSVRPGEKSG